MDVLYGVEGMTDESLVRRLLSDFGISPVRVYAGGGKSKLDPKVARWNHASNRQQMFVLRDWDRDDRATCPQELIDSIAGGKIVQPKLMIRVPVRAMESWILADAKAVQDYFKVTGSTASPDSESNPKQKLISMCARSTSKDVKTDMVPRLGARSNVGPGYLRRIEEFCAKSWSPTRARAISPSLDRCMIRIEEFISMGVWS